MRLEYVTNCHERTFLYGYELTPKELEDFDYMTDPDHEWGFIRYRGEVYHIDDFVSVNSFWSCGNVWNGAPFDVHASNSDTFFSAIVLNVSNDGETYRIARVWAREDARQLTLNP
jgi:hypothetical protein